MQLERRNNAVKKRFKHLMSKGVGLSRSFLRLYGT